MPHLTFMQSDPPAEQRIHSSDSVIIGSGEIKRFLLIENYKDLSLFEAGPKGQFTLKNYFLEVGARVI